MSDDYEEEDPTAEAITCGLDAALAQLPPRVAVAYAILRDEGIGDKGVRSAAKLALVQYIAGESDGA